MAKNRIHALVLAVLLLSALPARAAAADPDDRRQAARTKRAQAAAQLDTLKANGMQLEAAVQALDAGIAIQASATQSAQQAVAAAEEAVDAAKIRLASTETRMGELRKKVSAVAIKAYINPGGVPLLDIVKSKDFAEASRRQSLMSHVVSVDRSVLGELRAVRQDQQIEQANLVRLRDEAQERKRVAAEKLAELERARADQMRLKAALDVRIREYTAEVEALAREEANITRVIQTRQSGSSGSAAPSGGRVQVAARPSGSGGLVWPSNGGVSSPFGMRWGRMHNGIDIDSGFGAPIRAAKAGVVIMAGYNGGYGNCVIIDHGGGFTTLYAHQSRMAVGDGQSVGAGEVIGYVGGTGNVTGPHLHFETRMGGVPQNPMNYF